MYANPLEAVGPHFSIDRMWELRNRTRHAISVIANRIAVGMTEEDGTAIAKQTLRELGLPRGWHKTYVRFGSNTVHEYGVESERGVVLKQDDIFFIDIGPMCDNIEGDGGETFVVGSDEEMLRARAEVVGLWYRVWNAWRRRAWTGRSLYEFASTQATRMGWELNLRRMSGHRIGDFPHPHRFEGLLSDVDITPSPFVWVLEIHIRHPKRPFGAFFEDLLPATEFVDFPRR